MDSLTGGDLSTCSFHDQIAACAVGQLQNSFHSVALSAVDNAVSAQLQCLLQTLGHDVDHVNSGNALCLQCHHGHQADAACAEDNSGLADVCIAQICSVEADSQRLDQCAFHGADALRQLEAQTGFVCDVFLENAVHRGSSEEDDIGAQVVTAGLAEFALAAGLAGLQSDLVANLQVLDVLADFHNNAAGLMTQNEGGLDNVSADGAGLVVVQITAADADVFQLDENFVVLGSGDGTLGVAHLADAVHNGNFHSTFHVKNLQLCV